MDHIDVAVVGALGAVGREMIKTLEKSTLPVRRLVPMDVVKNEGKDCVFRNKRISIVASGGDAFRGVDIALFSAGADASKELAPLAVKNRTIIIDNSNQ